MKFLGATLISMGGATVVIVGLSKWFGDFYQRDFLTIITINIAQNLKE